MPTHRTRLTRSSRFSLLPYFEPHFFLFATGQVSFKSCAVPFLTFMFHPAPVIASFLWPEVVKTSSALGFSLELIPFGLIC